MRFIRRIDLNDRKLDPKIASLWKIRYFGLKFSTTWIKFSFVGDKLKEKFALSRQELDVLEALLWGERITIVGISKYLGKEMSNISRTVRNLREKGVLRRIEDKTLNITKEFADEWYCFLQSDELQILIEETIDVIEPEIKNTISRFEETLVGINDYKNNK